jgi:hypothetical protein
MYLERVLASEQVDDLKGVLHNPNSHQLLAFKTTKMYQ